MRPVIGSLLMRAPIVLAGMYGAAVHAQQPDSLWSYTLKIAGDSNGSALPETTVRQWVSARRIRMELANAAMAAASGSYTVFNAADSTISMVIPAYQAVTVTPSGFALAMAKSARPKTETHLTSNSLEDLGPGESILGHATHHYRVTTVGTIKLTLGGSSCDRRVDSQTEAWVAPDIDQRAIVKPLVDMGMAPSDMVPQWDSAMAKLPTGIPLRTVITSRGTDRDGKALTVKRTLEYTALAHVPAADSVFATPKGYQVMDMRGDPSLLAAASSGTQFMDARFKVMCETIG